MKTNKTSGLILMLVMLFVLIPAGVVGAKNTWLPICHQNEHGNAQLITVSKLEYADHLAHGDLEISAGLPEAKLSESCGLVETPAQADPKSASPVKTAWAQRGFVELVLVIASLF